MRIIKLSDHPRAQLSEVRQQRLTAADRARSDYEQALARHRSQLTELRTRRQTALAQRHWWAWLRWTFAMRRERRAAPRPPLGISQPSSREESLEAGIEGEQQVVTQLGRVLGDNWTLLRGYSNRRGEIDHLLLGPRGLLAIESKHRNATVHCDGDHWWFDKYDRYGNPVQHGEMADRHGRSPSQQLNEPAADLESFLASRGHHVPVRRVVLLTHPRSRLGTCRNPTVSIATAIGEVISLLDNGEFAFEPAELRQLEDLIMRDHRFHQARRDAR